ncbi:MAG: SRPBCC domain-containing protein [Candidatus Binataceae bacterium]
MKWPAGFEPEKSSVYARNEIVIAAPPERIWRWMIRAGRWPEWYSNSSDVEFLGGNSPDLAPGTEFKWKTFGATITSRVIVFEPPREIAWDARGILTAVHGWTIEPAGAVCRVITEETQNGILPKLAWWYLRPMLERGHQHWVESLKRVAEGGDPS